MANLQVVHLFRESYPPEAGWRLLRWCIDQGASDFTLFGIVSDGLSDAALKGFDHLAAPHRLPPAVRRDPSHSDERELELWALNDETLQALHLAFPRGVFDYDFGADAWFEDLSVYREGELMVGIITHEGEGVLRLTANELSTFHGAGFSSRSEGKWVDYV